METINQNHLIFNNINNFNVFEKEKNLYPGINELSSSPQIPPSITSSLGNINEVLKFYELRNAILSNNNAENDKTLKSAPLSNACSITIPTSADYGIVEKKQNIKADFSFKNIASNSYFDNFASIKNKRNIPNITVPNEIKPINQKSAFDTTDFRRSILSSHLNNIDMKYPEFENQANPQYHMDNILNNFDVSYSNPPLVNMNSSTSMPINTANSLSGIQISNTTSSLTNMMNNNSFAINNNAYNKNAMILKLMELLKTQKQLLEIRDKVKEIESINIPSSPSNNYQNNNQFINSITIPSETENNSVTSYLQPKFTDGLLKQLQTQPQPTAIFNGICNNNNINDILNKQVENVKMSSDIPSIIVDNTSSNVLQSLQPISLESTDVNNDDIYDILKKSSTSKHEEINRYKPLSPELSPHLNMPIQNCMKKNENNAFTSTETLNDILSITPEMDNLDIPDYGSKNNHVNEKDGNENEVNLENIQWDSFFESLKDELDNVINSNEKNFLNVDNDFLNAPETPKSVSDLSSIDIADFPNLTDESNDNNGVLYTDNIMNDIFNNENTVPDINNCEDNGKMNTYENNIPKIVVDYVEEKVQPCLSEQNHSQDSKLSSSKEKPKVMKKSRGRPRKKRIEEPPKSPKVKIEEMAESVEDLRYCDLYRKLNSKEKINSENLLLKKECFDHDYKFVKQDNTSNYILISNEHVCNSICQNNNNNTKTISEATESQYDIPEINNVKVEFNNNECDCICNDKTKIVKKECEKGTLVVKTDNNESNCNKDKNESTFSDNENEEESLLTRMKEIQQQKCLETNNNMKKSNGKNTKSQKVESANSVKLSNNKKIITRSSRKRKRQNKEDNESEKELMDKEEVYVNTVNSKSNKRKVVRLSIKQIKNSLENGNRLSIGNSLGTNSVTALTQNGLVLVGRKRMIAENTNRPYVCSTCGAGFVRKHDLNRHEKVHTGIKNYKCPYCERAFSRNDALTRHLRVELKHRSQNDEENKKKKLKK